MTDDERCSLWRKITDAYVKGSEQDYAVWEMIQDAEHDARAAMIQNLTKHMLELSDIAPEDRQFPRSVLGADGKFHGCEYFPLPVH
ncbi:MAG: hypothetical protein WCD69_11010 [Xanthobacteraceae bacterium]